jgi:putative peptidoglycan lipid II flippase
MGYALGLPAYIVGKVFASVFWAQHDTTTPVKISIANSILNTFLCFLFVKLTPLGIAGVAAATGVSGWLQLYLYNRKVKGMASAAYDEKFKSTFPKIALSSSVLAVVLAILSYVLAPYYHGTTFEKIGALAILIVAGVGAYASAIWYFDIINIDEIKKILNRRKMKNETNPLGDATDE